MILNDTSAANSRTLIERFLEYVRDIKVAGVQGTASVTCSIGFTELENSDSVKSAIERADAGLYKAKNAGRNQAALAEVEAEVIAA